jgi:hypothetical protein
MPDYTDLPNSAVGVGGVPSGTTVTALRDNPLAIAEGAAGAPRVQTAGIEDNAITAAKIPDGSIGAEKFQLGTDERDWVGERTASLAFNAQGTYVMARNESGGTLDSSATVSGANIRPSSQATRRPGISSNLSGTWRCMGYAPNNEVTLFLRVS